MRIKYQSISYRDKLIFRIFLKDSIYDIDNEHLTLATYPCPHLHEIKEVHICSLTTDLDEEDLLYLKSMFENVMNIHIEGCIDEDFLDMLIKCIDTSILHILHITDLKMGTQDKFIKFLSLHPNLKSITIYSYMFNPQEFFTALSTTQISKCFIINRDNNRLTYEGPMNKDNLTIPLLPNILKFECYDVPCWNYSKFDNNVYIPYILNMKNLKDVRNFVKNKYLEELVPLLDAGFEIDKILCEFTCIDDIHNLKKYDRYIKMMKNCKLIFNLKGNYYKAFSSILPLFYHLEDFFIHISNINMSMLKALSEHIHNFKNLKCLMISGNLNSKSVPYLKKIVQNLPEVKILSIHGNINSKDNSWLYELCKQPCLKFINIGYNNLSRRFIKSLKDRVSLHVYISDSYMYDVPSKNFESVYSYMKPDIQNHIYKLYNRIKRDTKFDKRPYIL